MITVENSDNIFLTAVSRDIKVNISKSPGHAIRREIPAGTRRNRRARAGSRLPTGRLSNQLVGIEGCQIQSHQRHEGARQNSVRLSKAAVAHGMPHPDILNGRDKKRHERTGKNITENLHEYSAVLKCMD